MNKSFLLVGKCRTKKDLAGAGGVIRLFEVLIEDLTQRNIEFSILDLNRRNYGILGVLVIYWKLIGQIGKHDVVFFNGTAEEYRFYAWYVVLFSKIFRKKTILRKFAGNFDLFYEKIDPISRRLITYALSNADLNYFETKYLVKYFQSFGKRVYQFPNVRMTDYSEPVVQKGFEKKFVFLSHIKTDKGVNEILEAGAKLPEDYIIHLYGPVAKDYKCPEGLKDRFEKTYKGPVDKRNVLEVLNNYDVVLLPTYHKGEGHPGVIIEAFSMGKPVIATPLRGIKEIVQDGVSGFLVPAKDPDALYECILKVSKDNYASLCSNALSNFTQFDNDKVMDRVLKEIKNCCSC
ncbi:MAG: glycosyltransferase family 4 protein [Allomuricauda sp.]